MTWSKAGFILISMTTTLTVNGTVALPSKVLRQQKVRAGDHLEIIADADVPGVIELRRVPQTPNEGLAEWLRACPAKGLRLPRRSRELPRMLDL